MGRVILAFFLAVILALGLSIFSAWNWVDGQLNKQSWLTNKADTAGESWLILGSDEREGTVGDAGDVTGFRTDTILVLTKPKSGPSSLISIPRDSLVEIDQSYMKINAVAQLYNGKQLVNEVEDITGQKINHVAMVQFGGLVKVVDALGGVELCYDQDVSDPYSQLNWTAGCHTADGTTALAFSRMRYADAQGDFGRAARQRQVINAIVKKGASKDTLLNFGKVKKVAEAALGSVTVDEKASTSSLMRMALAFKSASGDQGISGSVYWTDPDYYVDGVGSSVLLDEGKNLELFSELAKGDPSGWHCRHARRTAKLRVVVRMWITISSDHNPDSRLRPSATAVHNDGMNSKTKRKHTNGFNEDRLMLISWAAPVLSQLVMLVIMIAQRQWRICGHACSWTHQQRVVSGIHGVAFQSEAAA